MTEQTKIMATEEFTRQLGELQASDVSDVKRHIRDLRKMFDMGLSPQNIPFVRVPIFEKMREDEHIYYTNPTPIMRLFFSIQNHELTLIKLVSKA